MLPDLRIVIAAVISTFVLTVGVGFYASSRLIQEPKRTDSLAALEETPVNRIALSWPAPTRQADQPALDFAVTAKALRNPVRDITNEPATAWQAPQQSAAVTPERSDAPAPAARSDASIEVEPVVQTVPMPVAPADIAPASSSQVATPPAPSLQPDIRVAVQYPPIEELPPELKTPVPAPVMVIPHVAPAQTVAASSQPAQDPVHTGSVVEKPVAGDAETDRAGPEARIASRPEPESVSDEKAKAKVSPTAKTGAKAARKKAAKKKATPKPAAKRTIRRAAPRVTNTVPNFFNFFTTRN